MGREIEMAAVGPLLLPLAARRAAADAVVETDGRRRRAERIIKYIGDDVVVFVREGAKRRVQVVAGSAV